MCGINGILRLTPAAPSIDLGELRRTRDAMAKRGPDGVGEWIDADGQIALGHRRLAIIDLSPGGLQPMHSADGRFSIVFNGEIYNYAALREELQRAGLTFRTKSDTEVILALFAREGSAGLAKLRGMFALALWDAIAKRLTLARDPYGIKPLYYSLNGGTLRFASQVRALVASGAVSTALDPGGLAGFLLWGSVPEPFTIRSGVRAVPAGQVIEVQGGQLGTPRPLPAPLVDAVSAATALDESVRAHLVSDVPVGVFLSAGLDSALVAALACRHLPEPPVMLTLAFDSFRGTPQDEAPLAAEVGKALGARHIEVRLQPSELEELWPQALAAMDQPSIDGFNTYLISHAAHAHGLKVVLSGLGGDEIFGSYPSFRDVPRWAAWVKRGSHVPGLAKVWPAIAGSKERPKLRGLFEYGNGIPGAYYLRRGLFLPDELSAILGPDLAAAGLAAYDPVGDAQGVMRSGTEPWLAVHQLESSLYMRNQLLRDSDWASMAHSVELRVPLVDAFLRAQMESTHFEPARSQGKASLVRSLASALPGAVFHRRKSGFAVPRPQRKSNRPGLESRALARELLARQTP